MDLSLISVDVYDYIRDCPPWDLEIDDDLLQGIAQKIADRFDSSLIYDQIDRLGCQILREQGLAPDGRAPEE